MARNADESRAASADRARADRERAAGRRLLRAGAEELGARPWRPTPVPPSAVDLTQYALWRADELDTQDLLAALTLLPAARAEVDELEAGMLFTARTSGLTWTQIAEAMGFSSPQACQQRYQRLAGRQASA